MASKKPTASDVSEARSTPARAAVDRALGSLASLQARRPSIPILICLLLAGFLAFRASKLELKTRFDQLLPENQPSVVELRRVLDRTVSASKMFVVIEGPETKVLRACGDALVPRLEAIGGPSVTSAEDGIQVARNYLLHRSGLFTSVAELEKLDHDFEARWDYEISKAVGTALEDDVPPPPFSASEIKKRFQKDNDQASHYPDGYYQSADGKAVIVVVSTAIAAGDLSGAKLAYDRVRNETSLASATGACKGARISYSGDLVSGLTEYGAVRDDLLSVGTLGVGMVLGIILLFFMRVRALIAMGATIATGLAWTFGLTQIFIGHLNVATGFLVSIVAGNGINFGIIFIARYFEEQRNGRSSAEAIAIAHKTTWPSTLTAAMAAAASYGSLWITDFRAFKHFAFIGGAGMVVCWVATYALLPAMLVVLDRLRPFRSDETTLFGRLRTRGLRYDAPFAAIVPLAPRFFAIAGLALAIAGVAAGVVYVRSDPMEYDMRRVRGDAQTKPETKRLSDLSTEVLGGTLDGAMVVVVDNLADVEPLTKALEARRDAAPAGKKPFQAVHSLFDFVAKDQAPKLPWLASIRERLLRARGKGFITDADWPEIEASLPPDELTAYGIEDLPPDLARAFTERDGTRGRVLLIEPTVGEADTDLHYLLRWSASFRETRLPNGALVRGSGRAVIFADMLKTIVDDIPAAIALSFSLTVVAVVIVFRRGASSLAIIGALLVGVAWLVVAMYASHVKLNLFNFVALPITFGIGVDYAVNLIQRYETDRSKGVLHAVRTTGGAVVLCSLTTVLGYLALLGSVNPAIRSLGWLAVLGEICCLFAALVVLPGYLYWRTREMSLARAGDVAKEEGSTPPPAA